MTPQECQAWRWQCGFSIIVAAALLNTSVSNLKAFESGQCALDGRRTRKPYGPQEPKPVIVPYVSRRKRIKW
jgi:hypothetical protein